MIRREIEHKVHIEGRISVEEYAVTKAALLQE